MRATVYAPVERELVQQSLAWLADGPTAQDEVIKSRRVWRRGALAIKSFPPRARLARPLRRTKARLCAELHSTLAPVATPRPFLVLEDRRRDHSLLVSEFVEGRTLDDLWSSGGAAVEALPRFLAAMHRRRIFHGDLHLGNFLWNGGEWVLLDLDGLRHPLHALRGRVLAHEQWARVHFGLRGAPGLRAAFDAYLAAASFGWDPERSWRRIVAASARRARHYGLDTSYADSREAASASASSRRSACSNP